MASPNRVSSNGAAASRPPCNSSNPSNAPTDVPDGRWVNAAELAALPMPTAVKAARKFAEEALKA